MKTINLEEIAKLEFPEVESGYGFETLNAVTKNLILRAMKESIRQSLELAAENANNAHDNRWKLYPYTVNKQAILDTINQIE